MLVTQRSSGAQPSGVIRFQPDGHGGLRQVSAPRGGQIAAKLPPLWKPEPGLLLNRGTELGISKRQRSAIGNVAAQWARERSSLIAQMDACHPRTADVTKLEAYSDLSRAYDATRAERWRLSLAVLSSGQQATVEQWRIRGISR